MIREENLGCGHCRFFYKDSHGNGYCQALGIYSNITCKCQFYKRGIPMDWSERPKIEEMPNRTIG